jgi:hypothetical protein
LSIAARKYGRTKSLVVAVLFFLLSGAETFACSRMPRTREQLFDSYIAVFSGVAISAEVIPLVPGTELEKEAAKTGIMPIKVRWKIDEIFKGKDLEGKSAFTTNYYCGGVPIIVGQPYVFAIGPIERDSEIFGSSMNSADIIGYLDDLGTMGIFSFENAPEKYNSLVAGFKKLSKHR